MSVDLSKSSIAKWYGESPPHRCGYCRNPSGNISHGMQTEQLTVKDYKDLIDRGWRRSGKYCYKPTMDRTCCPQYTIRCDTTKFSLNKSHKKIIKKFNRFLGDGVLNKNLPRDQNSIYEDDIRDMPGFRKEGSINLAMVIKSKEDNSCESGVPGLNQMVTTMGSSNVSMEDVSIIKDVTSGISETVMNTASTSNSTKKLVKHIVGADPSKPQCKKAKLLRLERKKEKMLQKGQEFEGTSKPKIEQKTLSQFLEEIPANAKHKLKFTLIPTSIVGPEWENVKEIEYELYIKYQTVVHNDKPSSINSFIRSWVSSPLKPEPFPEGIEGPGYGSFHQQYWIDDKLIAVGVIDILPGCVSSVYFFYDPDYRDLTLGTYGSLREVQLVQKLQTVVPDLKYYYMGFYIHSCPKMRYKGRLNPSYLLCPETYVWTPIEKCLGKLDVSSYSRLNEDLDALDTNSCRWEDIQRIRVVYDHMLMYARDYLRDFKNEKKVFENFGNLVGKQTSRRIIFWVD